MAQYDEYDNNTVELTDGTDIMRMGETGDLYVIDMKLTPLGFSGIEDTDWVRILSFDKGAGNPIYRHGVRDNNWVLDNELTATGFAGTINIDWTNILTIPRV